MCCFQSSQRCSYLYLANACSKKKEIDGADSEVSAGFATLILPPRNNDQSDTYYVCSSPAYSPPYSPIFLISFLTTLLPYYSSFLMLLFFFVQHVASFFQVTYFVSPKTCLDLRFIFLC